jgi:hypothetical protein
MSRVMGAALAAALVAAATPALAQSGPPGPGWRFDNGSWLYLAERARRDELIGRADEAVRDGLRRFAAEPDSACDSGALAAAERAALTAATAAAIDSGELDTIAATAGLLLDVADAAADRGCADVARSLYQTVIAGYTGRTYAAQRQRAEIGLNDLGAAGR